MIKAITIPLRETAFVQLEEIGRRSGANRSFSGLLMAFGIWRFKKGGRAGQPYGHDTPGNMTGAPGDFTRTIPLLSEAVTGTG